MKNKKKTKKTDVDFPRKREEGAKKKTTINDKPPINHHHTPRREEESEVTLPITRWNIFGHQEMLHVPPKRCGLLSCADTLGKHACNFLLKIFIKRKNI
jgi:hypothetical protein